MPILINFLLAIDVIVSALLILVVLMQRPKNEGLGAAFGGGVTENIFGAQTTNVLASVTRWLGGIFFVVSVLLSFLYSKQAIPKSSSQQILEQSAAKATPKPAVAATPMPNATPTPGATPAPANATPVPSSTPAAGAGKRATSAPVAVPGIIEGKKDEKPPAADAKPAPDAAIEKPAEKAPAEKKGEEKAAPAREPAKP
jgi:preprotein translocase subunit SecG